MSTILTTDFTKQLSDTKTFLDRFFRIPLKEDAAFIIKKMKSVNTERDKSVLGDYEIKLLEILNNDRNYIADHPDEQPDGTILAKGLSDGNFSDIDVNNEVMSIYEADLVRVSYHLKLCFNFDVKSTEIEKLRFLCFCLPYHALYYCFYLNNIFVTYTTTFYFLKMLQTRLAMLSITALTFLFSNDHIKSSVRVRIF